MRPSGIFCCFFSTRCAHLLCKALYPPPPIGLLGYRRFLPSAVLKQIRFLLAGFLPLFPLDAASRCFDGLLREGAAYYRKGGINKAIADYSQTIRLDPDYTAAYQYFRLMRLLTGLTACYGWAYSFQRAVLSTTLAVSSNTITPAFPATKMQRLCLSLHYLDSPVKHTMIPWQLLSQRNKK
jgi:tetratricopeptide (TPR) repeat protein